MFLIKDFKGFTTYEKLFFGLFMLVQVAILKCTPKVEP